jgi:hypothetical protein
VAGGTAKQISASCTDAGLLPSHQEQVAKHSRATTPAPALFCDFCEFSRLKFFLICSRHRARFASANGAPQPQPSAIGLGTITHKIPSSEGANQTFARLDAS